MDAAAEIWHRMCHISAKGFVTFALSKVRACLHNGIRIVKAF